MEMDKQRQAVQATRFHNPFSVSSFSGVSPPNSSSSPLHTFSAVKMPAGALVAVPSSIGGTTSSDLTWSQLLTQFPSIFPAQPATTTPPNSADATVVTTSPTTTGTSQSDSNLFCCPNGTDQEKDANKGQEQGLLSLTKQPDSNGVDESDQPSVSPSSTMLSNPGLIEFQKFLHSFNIQQQQQASQQQQLPFAVPFPPLQGKLQQQLLQQMFGGNGILPTGNQPQSTMSRRLQVDENGEALCPICSQKIGSQPSQWREHARLERARLLQLLQQLKVERNKFSLLKPHGATSATAGPNEAASQLRDLELRRIRTNQQKRAQMKQLLAAAAVSSQQFSAQSLSQRQFSATNAPTATVNGIGSYSTKDEINLSTCSECRRECEFFVISATAPLAFPRCLACFQRSGLGADAPTDPQKEPQALISTPHNINGEKLSESPLQSNAMPSDPVVKSEAVDLAGYYAGDFGTAKRARLDVSTN